MKVKDAKEIINLVQKLGIGHVKSLRNSEMTVDQEIQMMSKSLDNKSDLEDLGRGVSLSFERMKTSYEYLKGNN